MGEADDTNPYQAELTGIDLAVTSAKRSVPVQTDLFWFFTDNQTIIRDLTETSKVKPGMTTCARIRRALTGLLDSRPGAKVALVWCPSKKGIGPMIEVDAAAKEAVHLRLPQPSRSQISDREVS